MVKRLTLKYNREATLRGYPYVMDALSLVNKSKTHLSYQLTSDIINGIGHNEPRLHYVTTAASYVQVLTFPKSLV